MLCKYGHTEHSKIETAMWGKVIQKQISGVTMIYWQQCDDYKQL